MPATVPPNSLFAGEEPVPGRILHVAHHHRFEFGYNALTMDELAHELGISKKTLYVHFPSKDAMIERIIDVIGRTVRTRLEAVVADPKLTFNRQLQGIVRVAGATFGTASPAMLRDLQRFAPHIYRKIEDVRLKLIPLIFGRLIRTGIREGMVRPDVDPAFATEFWLHAIRGLVQPATLDRTHLTLNQTLERALHLFARGLLTPAGRKDHEKHLLS
jgi:AcrR family transcriptional regulator